MQQKQKDIRSIIEKAVIVFVLAYGLRYIAYFLRARYFNWLGTLTLDAGVAHALVYLGQTVFLAVFFLYAAAVRGDRKYIIAPLGHKPGAGAVLGAFTGFGMMGICILAASLNGTLTIRPSAEGFPLPLVLLALAAVFLQASVEEIESRAFVFGKMYGEGVPLTPSLLISAFYFAYLHAANPGFGLLPMLNIFVIGILYALCYHYFGNIWFPCAAHTMWNFTQDFIFGLPDSGHPAAVSFFTTTVNGSGFFYDEVFGIEGSVIALLVGAAACAAVFLIGRKQKAMQ